MIPLQLTLHNFLSYQAATLDFRGLHTACICGPNGAGKSSLLEAIAWSLWGESRATSEDDIIHQGALEARVDFVFSLRGQTYRVLRSRTRGQGVGLEFQVAQGEETFRALSAKGVKATQQLILDHIKLDYETFINSAYLRQGQADAFMLKRPAERKQILADLLKLQEYDGLADRARDRSRQLKGQVDLLTRNRQEIDQQLAQQATIAADRATLEAALEQRQQQQTTGQQSLQTLLAQQQQQLQWQQQIDWQQQQQQQIDQDLQRQQQELAHSHQEITTLEALFEQEGEICTGYSQWQNLQVQEEFLAGRWQLDQQVQADRQAEQQLGADRAAKLTQQQQQIQAQDQALTEELAEVQKILSKAGDLEPALGQLAQARQRLQHFDQVQLKAVPLLERRRQIEADLDRASHRLNDRLQALRRQAESLESQQAQQPQLQAAVAALSARIAELDRLRQYQEQVREKGLERRNFMERLQAHQRSYETQLAELEPILSLLQGGMSGAPSLGDALQTARARPVESAAGQEIADSRAATALATQPMSQSIVNSLNNLGDNLPGNRKDQSRSNHEDNGKNNTDPDFPPCPLCDRPLDEHHWQVVLTKHQAEQQDILDQIWVIREQLAVSEREIQILRQEYRDLEGQLAVYGPVMQQQGQLREQLQASTAAAAQLAQLWAEVAQLEQQREAGVPIGDHQEELHLLDQTLAQLDYDDKDHALARGQVDQWRWAEIKQAELKQAQRRQQQIGAKQPALQSQLQAAAQAIAEHQAATATALAQWDQQLADIGYSVEQHSQLRAVLRQNHTAPLRYQELQQARQQFPALRQRWEALSAVVREKEADRQALAHQQQALQAQLAQSPDPAPAIARLQAELAQSRQQLDLALSQLGRLQQQQQHLSQLATQAAALQTQQAQTLQQYRVYQELTQAFGKNGIPALMIENILPQLEAVTNQVLARLSGNQLHVQFVTQRASKSAAKRNPKLIDTLDILIADAHGTRPYETYSGGEAFRINFAIRLALAQMLSQRSGATLQMLIVDEGFGTQDQEGCDRLIAAINAIAADFACILTITHMPYFRDAFQARIEVTKTNTGSHLSLCV
jgi:DNA repair protein SbcC/Rad50